MIKKVKELVQKHGKKAWPFLAAYVAVKWSVILGGFYLLKNIFINETLP